MPSTQSWRRDSTMQWPLFFFHAEDGIRVFLVTGVQTCALPISGGVGLGVTVLAAWGAALVGPGGQLRDRDEPVLRRGVPVLRLAVHLGDRERAGSWQRVSRRGDNPALPIVVRGAAVPLVHHLPDHDGGGDQPAALRPARG